jgi:hypothetical protein
MIDSVNGSSKVGVEHRYDPYNTIAKAIRTMVKNM